ncbi:MAG TPA: GntR family transcriptional regulator [Actinomycetota bacterium]|nr:GntR family transcriptional regulator [Actinomycetota bacterium]
MRDPVRDDGVHAPPGNDSPNGEAVFQARPDRQLVTDWVYEELRGAIIDLRLQPGAPLREAAIATQLGVSKTPLREALGRLEQEGLVETTSFKGAVVTDYSERDLQEIYELRQLLEGAAVRTAATDASAETREELREVIEQSRALRDAGDLTRLADLLGRFDLLLYEQVTNRRIRGLIDTLRAHLTRIGKLTEDIPGRVVASVEEHAAIVEAIARTDPDEAERAIRIHIASVLADQLAGVRANHGEPPR